MSGTLFVVATPIGNLEDLTFRALRTLREVQLIVAEDTRRTAKLLAHYEVRRPLISLREHNEARETPRLVARLQGGESIALVSDAGTPAISDPGARLVRAVREADLRVVPIPGPSAITTALSVAGFAADAFVFMGFPPPAGLARTEWFARLASEPRLVVFFEAPHRIERTLDDSRLNCGERPIMIFRELTKVNEALVIRPIKSGESPIKALGEFVVVAGPIDSKPDRDLEPTVVADIFGHITELGVSDRVSTTEAVAILFRSTPSAVAKALKRANILVKRQIRSPS